MGRPASCFCSGSDRFGHLFAVDGCGDLDEATLVAHCGG